MIIVNSHLFEICGKIQRNRKIKNRNIMCETLLNKNNVGKENKNEFKFSFLLDGIDQGN